MRAQVTRRQVVKLYQLLRNNRYPHLYPMLKHSRYEALEPSAEKEAATQALCSGVRVSMYTVNTGSQNTESCYSYQAA